MPDTYKAVCQWCGKQGNRAKGSSQGGIPNSRPLVPGKCNAQPSGNPNAPHSPKWEKA